MKPNRSVEKTLKGYDKNITIKWNNEYHYWEIWYKRPSGNKLITPVVESIYREGGSPYKFCPLDYRIIDWMYSADTTKHTKKWRWLSKRRFMERLSKRDVKTRRLFENVAKDSYNVLNRELMNPYASEATEWDRPDISDSQGSRMMVRSSKNAKKYFKREE